MAKRLYRVDAFWYVMAEDEEEAEEYRSLNILPDASVSVSKATYLDSEWVNAIPFNSDDDRTCGQIFHGKG